MLLIIDISHDSVTVSDFDMLRFRPASTERYSLIDFYDTNAILDHHFRQGLTFIPEACCIVCNAINTGKWVIPTHNPQMRLSVPELKAQTGIKKVYFLSPAEALSFSALVPEAGGTQHLTGSDNLAGEGIKLTVETRDRFSCSLLSRNSGRWQSSRICCNEPALTSDDAAITGFMHHYGYDALLNERGLVLLNGFFCARNDQQAEYLTYSDVLKDSDRNKQQERKAATDAYFNLLSRFFLQVQDRASVHGQDITFIVHTTQPDLFAVNYRQYVATLSDNSPVHSVYLNASETPRLYGAAAWVSQPGLPG